MKINKVILQNIGVYVNKNEFDLKTDKPIILIGGLNGRGKTTLLEAILFVLYGRRALEPSQKLEGYLHKISNISGIFPECFIEMDFQTSEQSETVNYTVRRSWDIGKKKPVLKTTVKKNGENKPALSNNWDMFVEEILPRAIAPFFFFDGEKVAELTIAENEAHIKNSIRALLGIDRIDRLITDLQMVVAGIQKQLHKSEYRQQLEQAAEDIAQQDMVFREYEEKSREIQDSLRKLETEKTELENEFWVSGGNYAERRSKLQHQIQEVQDKLGENKGALLELAASSLPLAMVSSFLDDIHDTAEKEKNQKEVRIFLRQFSKLYPEYAGGEKWEDNIRDFFSYVRKNVRNEQDGYNLDDDALERLREIPGILNREAEQCVKLLDEHEKLIKQEEELDNYLAVKVDNEQMKLLQKKLADISYQIGQTESEFHTVSNACREAQMELEILKKKQKQMLMQFVKEQEEEDENLRIMSYAQMQIEIMESYRKKLQALKANHLAAQMTQCFQRIIAKTGLIQEIQIDHETLEFTYYNQEGQKISYLMLSSGEKQLLVIAMLWALGICSKADFPLIIDTPLSRLDSLHRTSLIENYFPKASNQVIILSTDQEIKGEDYQALKKYVGKEYTLVYDMDTMSSSIQTGYFGGDKV